VIIHDIPLLIEQNLAAQFDVAIAIITNTNIRAERLISTRGYTKDAALARITAGAKDYERAQAADLILDGSGTPEQLCGQVDALWELLRRQNSTESR